MTYRKILLSASCALIVAQTVFADGDNPYVFGGSCASQGAWTQAATLQTATVIAAVRQLQNDPNCKQAITKDFLDTLYSTEGTLDVPKGETNTNARLESIPGEISALRTFAVGNSKLKGDVSKLLMSRTVEGASLTAKATAAAGVATPAAVAAGLSFLAKRTSRTAQAGAAILDQITATLPALDQCLVGHPGQALQIFNSVVGLTASFASSGAGVSSRLGNSIANLISSLQKRKFTTTLRKLNESQFWLSMSCLLETTAQTYCTAEDGQHLLQEGIQEMRPSKDMTADNPLAGYYVMTRYVPVISEWLQKIQFGVKPKWSTDAQFKINALDNVNNFTKDMWRIEAAFSEGKSFIDGLKDKDKKNKKYLVLDMLKKLTAMMGGSAATAASDDGTTQTISPSSVNFYTATVFGSLMPFYLIGRDVLPDEVSIRKDGMIIPWTTYMENKGNFQPEFDNPDALVSTIRSRLDSVIEGATEKANTFYRQRLIIDVANLVNESRTAVNGISVFKSMQRVNDYLTALEKRIVQNQGDLTQIPNIRDTRFRINAVLKSYKKVRELVDLPMPNTQEESDEFSRKVLESSQHVVDTAFSKFNVFLQKDSFMTTRLSTFVQYDYSLRMLHDMNLGPYEKDLMLATGKALLDQMIQIHGINPANMYNDLNTAKVVNKRNMEAVEQLFSDSLFPVIEELDLIVKGARPSDRDLRKAQLTRLMQDARKLKGDSPLATTFNLIGMVIPGVGEIARETMHPDLYPMLQLSAIFNPVNGLRGKDDAFGSYEQFKAKLCVQTLGFENRKRFDSFCRGSILKSPYDPAIMHPNRQASLRFPLNVSYDYFMTNVRSDDAVRTDSICAFRDYGRRNLVYWLTLDLKRNQTLNED